MANDYQEWLESGKKALQAGRPAEARRFLTVAVQANPNSDEGWLYLAATLPPAQACDALKRALKINPDNQRARRGLEVLEKQLAPIPQDEVEALFEELEDKQTTRSRLLAKRPATSADGEIDFSLPDQESIRKVLTDPYRDPAGQKRRRRRKTILRIALVLIVLALVGGLALFLANPFTSGTTTADKTAATEPTTQVSPLPTAVAQIINPTIAVEVTPTIPPTATVPPNYNLKLVQNERGTLKGFNITFVTYSNRNTDFATAGAGSPTPGRHFEGVLVELENIYNKALPVDTALFQAVDSRNGFLAAIPGGRYPSLDVNRLLPGEKRLGWITFEVEDATSLRRVVYNPQTAPDDGNSAEVNLVLPAATPVPTRTATPAVTPLPTATPSPAPSPTIEPTATPAPQSTATPVPTMTPVVVDTQMIMLSTPTAAPTNTPLATGTAAPIATATLPPATTAAEPTSTPTTLAPTPTPGLPTATPIPSMVFNQAGKLGDFSLTVSQHQASITAKPAILPAGYHYEAVKITLEYLGSSDPSEFLKATPFYLKDGSGFVYTVGPYQVEAKDRFDAFQFATTTKGPGKTKVTGNLYFLVSDSAKNPGRYLVFYSSTEINGPAAEYALK